jgi:hypothetical protein
LLPSPSSLSTTPSTASASRSSTPLSTTSTSTAPPSGLLLHLACLPVNTTTASPRTAVSLPTRASSRAPSSPSRPTRARPRSRRSEASPRSLRSLEAVSHSSRLPGMLHQLLPTALIIHVLTSAQVRDEPQRQHRHSRRHQGRPD